MVGRSGQLVDVLAQQERHSLEICGFRSCDKLKISPHSKNDNLLEASDEAIQLLVILDKVR